MDVGRLAEVRGHSAHYLARSDAIPSRGWDSPSLPRWIRQQYPHHLLGTLPRVHPPNHIPQYVVQRKHRALGDWYRLFLVPGAAHCAPNTAQPNGPFPQTNLAVLIDSVEKGVVPETLNATVLQGSHVGENVQICAWPLGPYWKNNGTVMEFSMIRLLSVLGCMILMRLSCRFIRVLEMFLEERNKSSLFVYNSIHFPTYLLDIWVVNLLTLALTNNKMWMSTSYLDIEYEDASVTNKEMAVWQLLSGIYFFLLRDQKTPRGESYYLPSFLLHVFGSIASSVSSPNNGV